MIWCCGEPEDFFFPLPGGARVRPSTHEKLCDQVLGGRDDNRGGGQLQEAVQEACSGADAGGAEEAAQHATHRPQTQDEAAHQQEEEPEHHQGETLRQTPTSS